MRSAILLFFMMVSVNASYSQFYDVKIVKKPRAVGTRNEPAPLPTKKTGQTLKINGGCPGKMDSNALKETSPDNLLAAPDSIKVSSEEPLFCAPLDTLVISSPFGYRNDPFTGKRKFHAGTDYVTASENVYAMMPGRIRKIGYDKKLGNYITIDHGDIRVTYAHLHTVVGKKDDTVFAGQSVGISGSTGRSTGEHLHIAIRYRKEVVDPAPLVRLISEYASRYSEERKRKLEERVMTGEN